MRVTYQQNRYTLAFQMVFFKNAKNYAIQLRHIREALFFETQILQEPQNEMGLTQDCILKRTNCLEVKMP